MYVKIKTWENMEKEFGVVGDDKDINCKYLFEREMEKQMPKNRIVRLEVVNENLWVWKNKLNSCILHEDIIEEYYPIHKYPQLYV